MKKFCRFLLVAVVALTTASCGFHLRGNYLLPNEVNNLSLTSFDQYSDFHRIIENKLKLHGITEVPPAKNVANLHIINESYSDDSTLSLYQTGRTAEKEISYSVKYRVTIPNEEPVTYTSTSHRSYLDNPEAALAKSVEEDKIRGEMQEQVSEQIMRQMARLNAVVDDKPVADYTGLSAK
ncbi:LPS assembly lipoprotein LptE [Vibrio sp. SS-MA-C1-2]|uniref:LPS-assembly lipoprotein LptE n=1 Tax=Vibrio sp. SS-MA-C1-2 TaxID=2908646 RepID=UPI001F181E17|nr:LPS assembly lipoprotein LptE [Vibrio sp. SS-MA-C1-2]UJF18817.1 LPS assembly lipoprotein LptE [Vibrio sp. SS-MA-C1-2]